MVHIPGHASPGTGGLGGNRFPPATGVGYHGTLPHKRAHLLAKMVSFRTGNEKEFSAHGRGKVNKGFLKIRRKQIKLSFWFLGKGFLGDTTKSLGGKIRVEWGRGAMVPLERSAQG